MADHALDLVAFEEPDLKAPLPECLPVVASLLWVGFRFAKDSPCLENVILGKDRLPCFKDAKRSELRREVRFHFISRTVVWNGEAMGPGRWVREWLSDPVLRKTVTAHPAFEKWRAGLAVQLMQEPLVALAEEGGRSCYGRFGGDAFTLREMHGFMDGEKEIA